MNWRRMTDGNIAKEIGRRFKRRRLDKNYTQEELAKRAGIHVNTLQSLEYGKASTMGTFIQVLRALKELDNLESLIPEKEISPVEQLKLKNKQRQRAS